MSKEPTLEMTLFLEPIPPDTVTTIRRELEPLVRASLREAGRESLWQEETITIEVEEHFPIDDPEVIAAIITVVGPIAVETYKQVILPIIKSKFLLRDEHVKEDAEDKKYNRHEKRDMDDDD